jgi:hypothetical protein
MKRLILLSLLVFITAVACKKDKKKEINKPISETLKGEWITISENSNYFDSGNNKIFEKVNNSPGSKYVIDASITKKDLQNNVNFSTPYSVSNVNGKNFISFAENGAAQTYEIVYIDLKMMTWKQEKANQTYDDNGSKMAAKQVVTMNFHCPCRD